MTTRHCTQDAQGIFAASAEWVELAFTAPMGISAPLRLLALLAVSILYQNHVAIVTTPPTHTQTPVNESTL